MTDAVNLEIVSTYLREMEKVLGDKNTLSGVSRTWLDPKTLEGLSIADLPKVKFRYEIDRLAGSIVMRREDKP